MLCVGIDVELYLLFFLKDVGGKWKGWEIDVFDVVCGKLNVWCEFIDIVWDGLIFVL